MGQRTSERYIHIYTFQGYMGYEPGQVNDKCYEQPAGQNNLMG